MFGVMCFARATDTNIHTNTLRGLKIYLLFNRLVRRYVMSVNVNVNVDVSIGKSTCTRRSYLTNILH